MQGKGKIIKFIVNKNTIIKCLVIMLKQTHVCLDFPEEKKRLSVWNLYTSEYFKEKQFCENLKRKKRKERYFLFLVFNDSKCLFILHVEKLA